jgi:hypothetical protein
LDHSQLDSETNYGEILGFQTLSSKRFLSQKVSILLKFLQTLLNKLVGKLKAYQQIVFPLKMLQSYVLAIDIHF